MLELVKIEENIYDETISPYIVRKFTLTFQDNQLPEQIWDLLEGELLRYKGQMDGISISCEVIASDESYINLMVYYSKKYLNLTDEEIDNFLEVLNVNFQDHYRSLLERIELVY